MVIIMNVERMKRIGRFQEKSYMLKIEGLHADMKKFQEEEEKLRGW